MESDDMKKIAEAMNTAGFVVRKLEMEKRALDETYTGGIIVLVTQKGKESGK
jgi:hypothetical protein